MTHAERVRFFGGAIRDPKNFSFEDWSWGCPPPADDYWVKGAEAGARTFMAELLADEFCIDQEESGGWTVALGPFWGFFPKFKPADDPFGLRVTCKPRLVPFYEK